jgi:hypothetical protein
MISQETRALVDKLLRERVSLAGIVRITNVSPAWRQTDVNRMYAAQPHQANVSAQKNGD